METNGCRDYPLPPPSNCRQQQRNLLWTLKQCQCKATSWEMCCCDFQWREGRIIVVQQSCGWSRYFKLDIANAFTPLLSLLCTENLRLTKTFLIFFANIRQRKNIWSVWVTQIESQTCLFHHFPRLSIEKARVMTRHQQHDGICGSCNKMLPWEISIGVRVSKGEMSRAADFYQYHPLAQKFHV